MNPEVNLQATPHPTSRRMIKLQSMVGQPHIKPLFALLPLLLVYVSVVLVASDSSFQADEGRYVRFATNLSQGYYSPPEGIDLWSGPGYPLVLLPFVLLGLPLLGAKLLNALFIFGAIVFFYLTLRLYFSSHGAGLAAWLLGAYAPMMREMPMLMTESLSVFLLSGFAYYFCRVYSRPGTHARLNILAAAGFLAFLALTKVLFGYVLLAVIIVLVIVYAWKHSHALCKSVAVYTLALIICLPYLYYTHSLTGKLFLWSTSGGMSLYWMSSPYPDDLGDWHSIRAVQETSQLNSNHQVFFDELEGLDQVARDESFRSRAIENITHNPRKYVFNWVANVGRMLFSYPYSYSPQRLGPLVYTAFNALVLGLAVASVFLAYRARQAIPHEMHVLMLMFLVAFAGSSMLSAYGRHFHVLVPVLALWSAFVFLRTVTIEIGGKAQEDAVRA